MSFLLDVKRVKRELVDSARAAVLISMIEAWNNCSRSSTGNEPEEPDFIASLVLNGTPYIESWWSKILKPLGYKINVTGIYCHQTPKVTFRAIKHQSCELGDLLWCHIHTDSHGYAIRNAILYQAKKSSDQPHRLHTGDTDQLELYSRWPAFTYLNSGRELNGKTRHVKPSAPRRGAQYLLIDDRPPENLASGILGFPGTYPIGSCIANNPIKDHSDLGLEFVHSLELLSGDPFDDRKTAYIENGWSAVVWDILESSAKKTFRRVNSGYSSKPRLSGTLPSAIDGCFYRISHDMYSPRGSLLDSFGNFSFSNDNIPPERRSEEPWFDEGGGGISVLLIETFTSG